MSDVTSFMAATKFFAFFWCWWRGGEIKIYSFCKEKNIIKADGRGRNEEIKKIIFFLVRGRKQ